MDAELRVVEPLAACFLGEDEDDATALALDDDFLGAFAGLGVGATDMGGYLKEGKVEGKRSRREQEDGAEGRPKFPAWACFRTEGFASEPRARAQATDPEATTGSNEHQLIKYEERAQVLVETNGRG